MLHKSNKHQLQQESQKHIQRICQITQTPDLQEPFQLRKSKLHFKFSVFNFTSHSSQI